MSQFSLKVKTFSAPIWKVLVFFSFLLSNPSLKAYECQIVFKETNPSWISNEEIKEEISSYLKNNSFDPVLTNKKLKYEISNIYEEWGIVYTLGTLTQGKKKCMALFSINKGWLWTTTDMLYMTTDTPQTPLLFRDISFTARFMLPNSLASYHVLIKKLQMPSEKGNWQQWTFYNRDEWIELVVVVTPSPRGGHDFMIFKQK